MKTMAITIEDASLKYLDRLYEIEMECFTREAFTKQQIAQLLANPNSVSLIAKGDNKIVGFIIGMLSIEDNMLIGHVLTIDVSPSHRRKGVGIKLLHEIEKIFKDKQARICRLEVREDNVAALNLYRKLGYKKVAKLEYYYGEAHGILLKKFLA
ncbi:MAG: ribosomal protein S18-alanine N-acetyltransferase [Candidatus Bathycorpusculaceae bacterium]